MFDNEFYISVLIAAYLSAELTQQQQSELDNWLGASEQNRTFFNEIIDEQLFADDLREFRTANRESVWSKTNELIQTDKKGAKISAVKKFYPAVYKFVAAAVVLIIVGLGVYFYVSKPGEKVVAYTVDLNPGKNKATILLAGGKAISLSDAKTGVVVVDNKLVYNDGSFVRYSSGSHFSGSQKSDQKNTGPVGVHSLSVKEQLTAITPAGGTYQITLSDGTRVWMNAASRIEFPARFTGEERRISLAGEAYLEVATSYTSLRGRRTKQSFVVESKGQEVRVLGTHFNINSYGDEESVKTTLLEGSVKVSSLLTPSLRGAFRGEAILKPGQQATFTNNVINVAEVDVTQAVAWKDGFFQFEGTDLKTVMRQIGRWYDVDIEYEGAIPSKIFTGKIYRNMTASKVLEGLAYTGLKFKISGKKIIVMQ